MSVLDFVDEALVWDTGSTDNTVEIIKSIKNPKIKFRQYGEVNAQTFTMAHNDMLKSTSPGWMFMVDGDEIWPSDVIKSSITTIKNDGNNYDFFIRHHYDLVGDVFHYQEEMAGRYNLRNYTGHFAIRAVNIESIKGIHFGKPHGQLGIFNESEILIQDYPLYKTTLLPGSFFHTTHLQRSKNSQFDRQVMKRDFKYKYELGHAFPKDFKYPEVFYYPRPDFVSSPWEKRSFSFVLNSLWQTPLKMIKRRLLSDTSAGY